MAQFGPLNQPFVLTDLTPGYALAPIPQGGLTTPFELTDAEGITGTLTNRFPTPPSAYGFLIDDFLDEMEMSGISSIAFYTLTPEGTHLEPTVGQIWPR